MKNLKYLECIQRETTRLYGPGNGIFFREALCDTSIKDIPIKRGTLVNIKTKGPQFSEKYFKDPFNFRPERWEKECSNLPPFVEGGFGAGARTCIGKHLAMFENKICIIQFLQRYKKIILPQE
jgi:cytochrome P450